MEPVRQRYGDAPSQWADLRLPAGQPRGVIVTIHGGFWRARYGASLAEPLARDLTARGWATLTIEYRRVGDGGGLPATLDDVAAAIDLLGGVSELASDLLGGPVVALGHSAGGHLAAWSAGRLRFDRWAGGVPVSHVIAQAGVLDLARARRDRLGDGAVDAFLGEDAAMAEAADPTRHVPPGVPVWCVHARDDEDVPFSQSEDYVSRAVALGGAGALVEVTGGHFGLIDVTHPAWAAQVAILDGIG